MTDILDTARERLAREDGRVRTHSDDCPRWHDACLIARLVKEIERLRSTPNLADLQDRLVKLERWKEGFYDV